VGLATLILVILASAMLFVAYRRGDGSHIRAIQLGWKTLRRTMPILILAFVIVGYVNTLEPQALVRSWIGPGTGLTGLAIGTAAGILLPGGPYVVFPLIGAMYLSGAGLGPTLAMITAWATLDLISVSFELPFMGWRFSLLRLSLSLPVPLLVGLAAHLLHIP
jgi:uncharacterized membrane protein YraQ (UPF0718 family)